MTQAISNPAGTPARDPALDGLRGIAILMVYVFHYGGGLQSSHAAVRFLGYVTEAGWIGVVLFFALSGFLITGSLWDSFAEPHWLRNFYARRSLRIFPLYYLAVASALIAAFATGSRAGSLAPFAVYSFFLQDIPHLAAIAIQSPGPLPLFHLWSLAVEEQFYLLWPAFLFVAYRSSSDANQRRHRAIRTCLLAAALSVLFCLGIYGVSTSASAGGHSFDFFLLTRCAALCLGAALALALRGAEWQTAQRAALPAFLSGSLSYLLVSWRCGSCYLDTPLQFTAGLAAVSLASAALIPLALRPGMLRSAISVPPLAWLGRISYGFYVFHILLRPLFDGLGTHMSHSTSGMAYQTVRFVTGFPITLLAAWLSFHFFEQPILRLKSLFPLRRSLPR